MEPSLSNLPTWDRLGGNNTMRRVVGLLVDRVVRDPAVRYDRGGKYPQTLDTIARTKSLALAFLSSALNGPLPYTGRSLAMVHQPMVITDNELDAFLIHFEEAMRECEIPSSVAAQLMAAVAAVRPLVVGT